MKIQILGTGCPKCRQLEANARAAVAELGIDAVVDKVTEVNRIIDMGVMVTPALALDGNVKSAGKILTKEQIITMLKGGG